LNENTAAFNKFNSSKENTVKKLANNNLNKSKNVE